MQDGRKAVWSIPYVSVAFLPSLKHNFITYHCSKVSIFIFEIHQLWQSGFSRLYSNCYCSCSFKPEIIEIGQSSQYMYSNNIVNFQESTTILNARTKKVWKLIVCTSNLKKNKPIQDLFFDVYDSINFLSTVWNPHLAVFFVNIFWKHIRITHKYVLIKLFFSKR